MDRLDLCESMIHAHAHTRTHTHPPIHVSARARPFLHSTDRTFSVFHARTMAEEQQDHRLHPRALGPAREHGLNLQKRQARVTVKYNRAELQRRWNAEKWIERALEELYTGAEDDMPEEIDIDDLLVLESDEERTQKLQELLQTCRNNTQPFISELLQRLHGLHKQEELQKEGIGHPCLHGYPHHHGNVHTHGGQQHHQPSTHQTL
ncbi:protein phosphatase 1, regulatory (inhibitor) subunit 14Aa [Tachysurus fulvidraco]|uniref:protein phosphatase 1, regulatory (inhibitor) subunit 14Aa n=1 Tax=Tachysurus fulvidraco TaxID=1234273 RepID=UPI000F4EC7B1|nr:protein phosphatase 1, regulatory (inhibitor) subunit 14Aa [Tachysurus fulvidraco]